jgi:hypothetical protein
MTAVAIGDNDRSAIMKHAAKVSKNTVFFMKGSELYSASGVPVPLSDIQQE